MNLASLTNCRLRSFKSVYFRISTFRETVENKCRIFAAEFRTCRRVVRNTPEVLLISTEVSGDSREVSGNSTEAISDTPGVLTKCFTNYKKIDCYD